MNLDNTKTSLTYKPYDKFKELINSNDPSVEKYFSTNTDGELIIAELETTSEEIITEYTDKEGNKTTSGNSSTVAPISRYSEKSIDYKSIISQYTTPISFFIELGTVTRNPEFLEEVAKLVKKSARIELVLLSTKITEEEIQVDNYTENVFERIGSTETTTSTTVNKTTTNTRTTETYNLKVSYANTWVCESTITYNRLPNDVQNGQEQNIQSPHKHTEDPTELKNNLQGDGNVTWYTNPKSTLTQKVTTEAYDNGTQSDYIDKTDAFINLLNKEYKIPNSNEKRSAGSYLKSGAEVLFQLLRQNPETQGLEQVMRYIMYKYTGKSYGVTSLDFSIFDPQYFTSFDGISGIDGVEGQIIDFLFSKGVPVAGVSAIMGNIQRECSFNIACRNSSNHIGICQWDWNVRGAELRKLAEQRGVTWETDLNVQLDFMWYELTNKSTYSKVYDAIMNATDEEKLEYTVWYFDRYYEVAILGNDFEIGKETDSCKIRYNYAKEWYKKLQEVGGKLYEGASDFYILDGHKFPHYMQKNYPQSYPIQLKDKTLRNNGCGPISLAMVLSGMLNDPTITPVTLINKLDEYYNGDWKKYYAYNGGTIGNNLFNTGFLQACYNEKLNVRSVSSQETAINEIASGKCANGHVTNHFVAVIPPPDQYKGKGYKFFILDSVNKLTGPYRSIEEVRKKNSSFKIQRIIEFVD